MSPQKNKFPQIDIPAFYRHSSVDTTYIIEDPNCGEATVWLALLSGN